eukprot:2097408-Prymnesium_polylepis.1
MPARCVVCSAHACRTRHAKAAEAEMKAATHAFEAEKVVATRDAVAEAEAPLQEKAAAAQATVEEMALRLAAAEAARDKAEKDKADWQTHLGLGGGATDTPFHKGADAGFAVPSRGEARRPSGTCVSTLLTRSFGHHHSARACPTRMCGPVPMQISCGCPLLPAYSSPVYDHLPCRVDAAGAVRLVWRSQRSGARRGAA